MSKSIEALEPADLSHLEHALIISGETIWAFAQIRYITHFGQRAQAKRHLATIRTILKRFQKREQEVLNPAARYADARSAASRLDAVVQHFTAEDQVACAPEPRYR